MAGYVVDALIGLCGPGGFGVVYFSIVYLRVLN